MVRSSLETSLKAEIAANGLEICQEFQQYGLASGFCGLVALKLTLLSHFD
jgi:hypothetical protein